MGIMLTIALELISILTKYSLKHIWSNHRRIHIPHHVQRASVCHHEASLCTERILYL